MNQNSKKSDVSFWWVAADLLVTAGAAATACVFLHGLAANVSLAVLLVRGVVLSRGTAVGQFCQPLAVAFLLTYLFRVHAPFEVRVSHEWIGAWTGMLALALQSKRQTSSAGLGGIVVASAMLFMIPPSDTSTVRSSVGLWQFELLVVVAAGMVAMFLSHVDGRVRKVVSYVLSPLLVLAPVMVFSPLSLSIGVPAAAYVVFWTKAFVLPAVAGAALLSLRQLVEARLREPGMGSVSPS